MDLAQTKRHYLVGRDQQLERLTAGVLSAVSDGAQPVGDDADSAIAFLVCGDPGIGKSALLEEVAERAGAAGMRVLSAAGHPDTSLSSFAGLRQLLQPLLPHVPALRVSSASLSGRSPRQAAALAEMQSAPLPTGILHRAAEAPTRYAQVRTHLLVPKASDALPPAPLVVYAHGGGWQIGDYQSHARFAAQIALRSGLPVLLVEYGLTPEARYPRPVHEIADTVAWVRGGDLARALTRPA